MTDQEQPPRGRSTHAGFPWGQIALVLLAAVVLVTFVAGRESEEQSAPDATLPAKVQVGSVARSDAGRPLVLNLPAASGAGNLLVATLSGDSAAAPFAGPEGWRLAVWSGLNRGRAEIWYLANNPGGVTRVTFTAAGATATSGQVSEWNGADALDPLDVVGSATRANASDITVSAGLAPAVGGELKIAAFTEAAIPGGRPLASAVRWASLGSLSTASRVYTGHYQLGVTTGSVTETERSRAAGDWSAVLATFRPALGSDACAGGPLGLSAAGDIDLRGASARVALRVSDMTGGGEGWRLAATSTSFRDSAGRVLPGTAVVVIAGGASAVADNCSLPTNSVSYPVRLPAGPTEPPSVELYDAAPDTGSGPSDLAFTFAVKAPAAVAGRHYSSTWTFTLSSGP